MFSLGVPHGQQQQAPQASDDGYGGLLTKARLNALPSSERQLLVRKMLGRRRRRELAAIVVRQWKWHARHGLQRVRTERAASQELLAKSHRRAIVLAAAFGRMQLYTDHRRRCREVRLADTLFLSRFVAAWRDGLQRALADKARRRQADMRATLLRWRTQAAEARADRLHCRHLVRFWQTALQRRQTVRYLFVKTHYSAWTRFCEERKRLRQRCADRCLARVSLAHVSRCFAAWQACASRRVRHRVAAHFAAWRQAARSRQHARVSLRLRFWRRWRLRVADAAERRAVLRHVFSAWRRRTAAAAVARRTTLETLTRRFRTLRLHRECGRLRRHNELVLAPRYWGCLRRNAARRREERAFNLQLQQARMCTPLPCPPASGLRPAPRHLPAFVQARTRTGSATRQLPPPPPPQAQPAAAPLLSRRASAAAAAHPVPVALRRTASMQDAQTETDGLPASEPASTPPVAASVCSSELLYLHASHDRVAQAGHTSARPPGRTGAPRRPPPQVQLMQAGGGGVAWPAHACGLSVPQLVGGTAALRRTAPAPSPPHSVSRSAGGGAGGGSASVGRLHEGSSASSAASSASSSVLSPAASGAAPVLASVAAAAAPSAHVTLASLSDEVFQVASMLAEAKAAAMDAVPSPQDVAKQALLSRRLEALRSTLRLHLQ